ncbi:hypothetical protein J4Q44_G00242400 [Coregonus suidteri]|uniref:Uncharacterized protein n=1 Tax=Coregonus suidteri TaxID=861788 RepID=A0AAN8L9Q6_9TELE
MGIIGWVCRVVRDGVAVAARFGARTLRRLFHLWNNVCCLTDKHPGNMWLNVTLGMCEDIVLPGGVRRYSEDRQGPPLSVCPSQCALHNQKSVWVNVFFWVLIVVAVFVQKHQVLGSEWSMSETEPFFP